MMLIKLSFLCALIFFTPLFSAGPVMHLWVAEHFCALHNITDESTLRDIIIGTEFPDIRYITGIKRTTTHPPIATPKEIITAASTPFEVGMNLHSWTDLVREKAIHPKIYDAIAPYAKGLPATLLKFIEDEVLANLYDGTAWCWCFDEEIPEELHFTTKDATLKWHMIIQWTISLRPSYLLWGQSYRSSMFGLSQETLYEWSFLIPELAQKPFFKEHVHHVLNHIESKLQEAYKSDHDVLNNASSRIK